MSIIRWIIGTVIFLAILLLSFANAEQATLHFFGFGSWQAPLIFIVFCAFALGVTCGLLVGVLRVARLRRELKKVHKALAAVQQERDALNAGNAAGVEITPAHVEVVPASLPEKPISPVL